MRGGRSDARHAAALRLNPPHSGPETLVPLKTTPAAYRTLGYAATRLGDG